MTALDQYIRLEATGRWRETSDSDWREVLVSFGNATLVLSDFDEEPLTHWSLAAIARVDGGNGPALYAPDAGTPELLEIADPEMVGAIAEVARMARIRRPAARRGRAGARWLLPALGAAALLGLAALWGPGALRTRAFALITPEQAGLVAENIRNRLDARTCTTPEGTRSLSRLAARVTPGTRVLVMNWDTPLLSVLPDGTVLIARPLVERSGAGETVAGWIALGAASGPEASPLHAWVQGLTVPGLLAFLASGEIGARDVAAMTDAIAGSRYAPEAARVARTVRTLDDRGVDAGPFLADMAGRYPDLALPGDPGTDAPAVIPRDQDWVALQNICGS